MGTVSLYRLSFFLVAFCRATIAIGFTDADHAIMAGGHIPLGTNSSQPLQVLHERKRMMGRKHKRGAYDAGALSTFGRSRRRSAPV